MSVDFVNVVVTCTARKTQNVPASLRLGKVSGETLSKRFEEWAKRIGDIDAEAVPAIDLYCGGAWSIIRKLRTSLPANTGVRIWIVSAGKGLIQPDTLIVPYAATFSNGHRDSVITKKLSHHRRSEWWGALVDWRRSQGNTIASLKDIASTYPNDPLLIALSNEYLVAIQSDIGSARNALSSPDRLVIICSGARKVGDLEANFLPCDARFENQFRCCRTDLNAHLLASIVRKYKPSRISAGLLAKDYSHQMCQLPEACHPKRKKAGDEDVENFIRKQFLKSSTLTHTNLLRLFRSRGFACEQGRFRQLFKKIRRDATIKKA